jgi:hypothetical protein
MSLSPIRLVPPLLALLLAAVPDTAYGADPPIDTSPPASPVKLVFVHHSTGEPPLPARPRRFRRKLGRRALGRRHKPRDDRETGADFRPRGAARFDGLWRTDVAAVDLGAFASVILTFRTADAMASSRTASVPPGTTRFVDVLASVFGVEATASASGSLTLASDHPLVVSSRTYNAAETGTNGAPPGRRFDHRQRDRRPDDRPGDRSLKDGATARSFPTGQARRRARRPRP